jgi:hypothetical protein
LGYEGEPDAFVPIKKPKGYELTDNQKTYNKLQRVSRAKNSFMR